VGRVKQAMLSVTAARWLRLIALACVGAVGLALVSQYAFDLYPCAWCVFQRLIYLVIALVCYLTLAVRDKPALFCAGGVVVVGLALGGALAAWYQYDVAAAMFSCAMTFADRFMVASGLDGSLPWLFGIQATCMDAQVKVLGVEYAIWSLALFLLLALAGILALRSAARGHRVP